MTLSANAFGSTTQRPPANPRSNPPGKSRTYFLKDRNRQYGRRNCGRLRPQNRVPQGRREPTALLKELQFVFRPTSLRTDSQSSLTAWVVDDIAEPNVFLGFRQDNAPLAGCAHCI